MRFNKKTSFDPTPLHVDEMPENGIARAIIDDIEKLHLSEHFRNQSIIIGSAALLFYGINPPLQPDEGDTPRPGDIDLASTAELMSYLHEAQATPAGHSVRVKPIAGETQSTILRIDQLSASESTNLTRPIDLIARMKRDDDPRIHDKNFRRHFLDKGYSLIVPGSNNIRVVAPKGIRRELEPRAKSDPKAMSDLRTFNLHARKR